ncbi:Methyl-accepting chemotaxis protein [Anaerosporobacter mobilis DSM 15930]|uniref:Methyl-accepting chemotaxis protein n=1 Tax=Anaerosporobacter mobilis DSM 15930 TaxID=1120996 RepID=A0A1M7IYD0_9FIRM|nr:methyl-accepting chemotaxis protein [Anaerosporobacter mobilis]SHM45800.1 Methyl-accepting chemotaxis protein [Anaerosporobacter mobilis DSM 15930]
MKTRIDIKQMKRKSLDKLHNLSIGKQLRYNTLLILALVCITAIIGLTNQLNMNNRLLSFYQDSYTIHTTSLYSKNSLLLIENYMYRAIATDKENLQTKYINESENAYLEMESSITSICNSSESIKSLSTKDRKELTLELEKLQRYRKQVEAATKSGNVDAVFKTYKNDYVPILTAITTTLDHIIMNAHTYADTYIDLSKKQTYTSLVLYIALTILGTIVAVWLSKKTSTGILTPMREIELCMNDMARGNLHTQITYSSQNELGNVCEATRVTRDKLTRYIENITDVLKELENRNLTHEPGDDYVGDFLPIRESLISIIEFLHENIGQIQDSCQEVKEMSLHVQVQSETIQSGAKTQTNTITSLTDSIHTISDYATDNADQATKLQEIFSAMISCVCEAQYKMDGLKEHVTSIEEQSNQISNIIQVIETIARKTRLVALNATIEAAHATNAGGTFLVVANEMTNLSAQCMEAASTIKPFIQTTLDNINKCSESASVTSESLGYTVNISNQMHSLVSNIHSSSQMQHSLVEQITATLPRVTKIANENEHSAEENMHSIQKHITEMDNLLYFVNCFRL